MSVGSVAPVMHDRHIPQIHALAERQGRCVSRRALLSIGVGESVIKSLVRRALLTAVFPGTYVVGVPRMTHEEFIHACVIHAGPLAWPTHRTGLELRGLLPVNSGFVTVTTRREHLGTPLRAAGRVVEGGYGTLTIRQSSPRLALPLDRVGGFFTTSLTRTLVDTAAQDGAAVLAKAWREGTYRAVLDADAIAAELDAHPRAGVRLVRERLQNARPVTRPGMTIRSRSGELEFLEFIRELGLPEPLVNHRMSVDGHRYESDFYFADERLAVETDGPHHRIPWIRAQDEVRDRHFAAAGILVHRIDNEERRADPDRCRDELLAAFDQRCQRAA